MTELQRNMLHSMDRGDFKAVRSGAVEFRRSRGSDTADSYGSQAPQQDTKRPLLMPKRPIGRNLWLAIWIITVIGAAQISLFLKPLAGLYINAAALASLIYLAIIVERARTLVIPAAIIPTAMMVGLSLPGVTGLQATVTVSTVVLLLGLVYQYLFTLDYPKEGFALKGVRTSQLITVPFMVVLGQVIGLIGFAFLRNQYEFKGAPLILVFLTAAIFAISEEILFRGIIQQRAMLLMHPLVAAVLSAVLYALVTIGHQGGSLFPIVGLLVGSATAYIYYRRQNLLLTIAVNMSTKLTYFGLVAVFVLR